MDLQTLTRRLNSFGGFDLSDVEATDLLNEAVRDLSVASGYPRKLWVFNTVPGQSEYVLPSDWLSPEWVKVDGVLFGPGSPMDAAQFDRGFLSLSGPGIWFVTPERDGLGLWPAPSDEVEVIAEYVFRPAALVLPADSPSALPEEFHPALLLYAASRYYATVEDNPELSQQNDEQYQTEVQRLRRHSISQATGNQPFQVGIQGFTA